MVGDGDEYIFQGEFVCLNNLRLVIQPWVCFNWLKRWLEVFAIAALETGFERLMSQMDQFV
jgi:hypothetical protein